MCICIGSGRAGSCRRCAVIILWWMMEIWCWNAGSLWWYILENANTVAAVTAGRWRWLILWRSDMLFSVIAVLSTVWYVISVAAYYYFDAMVNGSFDLNDDAHCCYWCFSIVVMWYGDVIVQLIVYWLLLMWMGHSLLLGWLKFYRWLKLTWLWCGKFSDFIKLKLIFQTEERQWWRWPQAFSLFFLLLQVLNLNTVVFVRSLVCFYFVSVALRVQPENGHRGFTQ